MPGSLGSIQFVLQHYSVGREFFRHPAADEEWWRGKEGEPQEVLLRTAVEYAFPDRQQFDASGEEGCQKSVLTTERFSFVATDERGQRSFGYALRWFEPPSFDTPRAFVLVSRYPCVALFSKILPELLEMRRSRLPLSSPVDFLRQIRSL